LEQVVERLAKQFYKPGTVVHAYNLSTLKAETGRLQVHGQPGLYDETLFQQSKTKQKQNSTF
jgi:hypothetical protein